MKNGEIYHFWAFSGDLYQYTLNLYRYNLGSGRFWPTYTGTFWVLVIFGQPVTVQVRLVPVHPALF